MENEIKKVYMSRHNVSHVYTHIYIQCITCLLTESKKTYDKIAATLSQLKHASDWLDQVQSEAGHDMVGISEYC